MKFMKCIFFMKFQWISLNKKCAPNELNDLEFSRRLFKKKNPQKKIHTARLPHVRRTCGCAVNLPHNRTCGAASLLQSLSITAYHGISRHITVFPLNPF
jgi:hypothetical protein